MVIHEIHDLSNSYVIDLMKHEFQNAKEESYKNYHPDYSDTPGNIFKILSEGRYKQDLGTYYVIEIDGKLVTSAGWNQYESDETIALALTRAYVTPKYRAKYLMGQYILPQIIPATEKYQHLYITINNYNSAIYKYFARANDGKSTALFADWPKIYRNFKPIGKKHIYNVEQYVVEYVKHSNEFYT